MICSNRWVKDGLVKYNKKHVPVYILVNEVIHLIFHFAYNLIKKLNYIK